MYDFMASNYDKVSIIYCMTINDSESSGEWMTSDKGKQTDVFTVPS
jgi:hypothetical protein